jgi:hypothetical protein
MKSKISFLAILAFALNVNYVCASECIGEDCELVFEESTEMLTPTQYEVNWVIPSQTITETEQTCYYDYNCPFETPEECAVWYKKPSYKTIVAPRAPHINSEVAWDMEQIALANPNVSANDEDMKPLVQRYHMLMNASEACCTAGILHKMRQKGATDKEIYEFLKDDANYFALTKRCLVMDDDDIISKYSNGVDGKMVADVRNACLCKNYQWFDSLLQPFLDMYEHVPNFQLSKFTYKYTDGLQREINVPINTDVQKVIGMTAACPK